MRMAREDKAINVFEISDSYEIEENPEIIDSVSHQSDSQIETISEGEEEGEES